VARTRTHIFSFKLTKTVFGNFKYLYVNIDYQGLDSKMNKTALKKKPGSTLL